MVQDLVKRSPLGHGARRLACKTTFYGALHVCVAAAMAYAVTGDLSQALGIGTIEPLVQTGLGVARPALGTSLAGARR